MLTADRLREVLHYSRATGRFNRRDTGQEVGAIDSGGYVRVYVDGRAYRAHRLAWLYVRGVFPSEMIDHRNRRKDDNRWRNLRTATASQNQANRKKSGVLKGVTRAPKKSLRPWMAQITVRRRNIYLGCFATAKEAHQAYLEAARRYHGDFAHGG